MSQKIYITLILELMLYKIKFVCFNNRIFFYKCDISSQPIEIDANSSKDMPENSNYNITVNWLVLLENPYDSEYFYVGLGFKEGENDRSSSDPILFNFLVTDRFNSLFLNDITA